MKPTIVVMTYDGGAPRYHGPFPTDKAAASWGSVWQAENGDDPRWQVLHVDGEMFRSPPVLEAA